VAGRFTLAAHMAKLEPILEAARRPVVNLEHLHA
jgi:hypothetical protein